MVQKNRLTSSALVPSLPARVSTRSGASFDPRGDVWEWPDGPYICHVDFKRVSEIGLPFKESLKAVLVSFVRSYSAIYVKNLFVAFIHLLETTNKNSEFLIDENVIGEYRARLGTHEKSRVGVLNSLLQKWVKLQLPGVTVECANYLRESKKPGNIKGEAVLTRDPVTGPFTENEYTALNSAVNAAYGKGELPLWALLLTRLLLACGGRIAQYAALKLGDFEAATSVLKLPQAKTGLEHARASFLEFDLSAQTSQLIVTYREELIANGKTNESPFFPADIIMPNGPRKEIRSDTDLFFGHCRPTTLSTWLTQQLSGLAPPTSRLDFAPLPINPQRFRYTLGTRMAEEGASQMVIAERLGHVDLQNVKCYTSASPKIVENYDKALHKFLAPLALAFKGRLVEDEINSTHKGSAGSRIHDFRVSDKGLGSCAGKGAGCGFDKPVACYSCFRFEPWLDAPHKKVLLRLEADRLRWGSDDRMAAVNDEPIRAVKEVISLCEQVWSQRGRKEGGQ